MQRGRREAGESNDDAAEARRGMGAAAADGVHQRGCTGVRRGRNGGGAGMGTERGGERNARNAL